MTNVIIFLASSDHQRRFVNGLATLLTEHDLALSWLFRALEQRDITLLTYLLYYKSKMAADVMMDFGLYAINFGEN